MQRTFGIFAGLGTQLFFLYTVWYLFGFLNGAHATKETGSLWRDALLALQYAIPHSLLLMPAVKKRLTRWIPSSFYGCFYCVATCAGLLITFNFWRSSTTVIWQLNGNAAIGATLLFYGAWGSLLYSLSLTGLGYQTGLTQWWYWLTKTKQPHREFAPHSLYRFLRHPVYLSFMGLLWFTPFMTLDRLLLAVLWSIYIFIGSYLKDERLAFYIGAPYRNYQRQVAGYPFFFFGPLGKLSPAPQISPIKKQQAIPSPLSPIETKHAA
ncbi:MAG: hypothetical protein KDA65_06255 [Planctomycetaceae bacterium]|nr:hypothetical protein [Planctomycetaceae bacterium]